MSCLSVLWNLSVGGGEDYRQNAAESHQSTEGELQFYAHVAALVLVSRALAFPTTHSRAPDAACVLFELRMCRFT